MVIAPAPIRPNTARAVNITCVELPVTANSSLTGAVSTSFVSSELDSEPELEPVVEFVLSPLVLTVRAVPELEDPEALLALRDWPF